jgi:hypothetical protein
MLSQDQDDTLPQIGISWDRPDGFFSSSQKETIWDRDEDQDSVHHEPLKSKTKLLVAFVPDYSNTGSRSSRMARASSSE